MRDYEIWHDEHKGSSSVNEYWHGILFVPLDKKDEIINLLKKIRSEHKYSYEKKLKFAGSLKKPKDGKVINNNLSLFSHLLIVKQKEANTKIYNRNKEDIYKKKFDHFLEINDLFDCKFALLKVPDNHKSFDKYPMTYSERVETTFSFVFRGTMHLFFNKDNPINIRKFYFDGCEHHSGGVNLARITKGQLRDYCSIDKMCDIDDRQICDRGINSALMISFVDNIIGAWTAKIQNKKDENNILYPINGIYERLLENAIMLNINGKWHKSITISEVCVKDGKIEFPNIFRDDRQETLF
ncbi:MAG: hypothetical protein KJ674_05550 [Nanoarchaeota archaeon]|nr:hypothetical protein [Nanoarchaeota archaeon]